MIVAWKVPIDSLGNIIIVKIIATIASKDKDILTLIVKIDRICDTVIDSICDTALIVKIDSICDSYCWV